MSRFGTGRDTVPQKASALYVNLSNTACKYFQNAPTEEICTRSLGLWGFSICGPKDHVRERLAVYRDAGVGTLGVTPTAFTAPERLEQLRLIAELAA